MKKYFLFLIVFFAFSSIKAHNLFAEKKIQADSSSLVVVPTFNQVEPICWGSLLADLPTTSTNEISGTWFPAMNNLETTTYVFTPNPGQDATTTSMTITVKPLLAPTVTCGVWSPNQKTFNWMPVAGATTYAITYAINGGPYINAGFGAMLSYTVSGVLQTDNIEILVVPSGSLGNCFTAGILECLVSPCPEAGIAGNITICDDSSTVIDLFGIITGEDSGGTWTRFSGTGGTFDAATGTFTPGVGATTSSFMYTVTGTTPCPNDSSLATITINTTPNAGILAGVQNICVGFTTSFTSTATGGVWSSSNPAVATVNPVTGIVTGMSAGTATMTYTMNGIAPCVNGTATRTVTVNAEPEQPSIQGFQGICVGSWTVFTATPQGGTWSSSNNAVAMVDFTGFILGNSAGVSTISYTISGSGGCADRTAVRNVTVSTAPTIVLASAPITANQTVCENTPITPIIYNIGTLNAQDAMAISLPPGVSGSYNAGVFTISGTPTASGTFPYSAVAVGPCGTDSLLGTITVNPSISTTMFCDPSGVTMPNTVRIDWANIVGGTNFQYAYSIDNGPIVTGATNISNYEILGVLPGQSVTFTLTNVVGISCFQSTSVTCTNLANESFEIDDFQSFPNPVSNVLNLTSSKTINNVAIINSLGQVVLNQIYNSKSIQIDMSRFTSGIYMVKLLADSKSKTIKIIKD